MIKKKLCLVIPTLQAGGMERVMSELTHFFCEKEEVEVHLILYGRSIHFFYELPPRLIIHTPDFSFNNIFRQVFMLRRLHYLRNTIKHIRPDVILSFGEYWNSFVLLAHWGLKYPVFVSDRCQPGKKMSPLHHLLRQLLYPRATGIVAQTAIAKHIYSHQLRHKNIRVIGNPIRVSASGHGTPKEDMVLSVGRLIRSKNHAQLIELFVKINKPGWKLVIVGGNALKTDLKSELRNLIDKLMVTDKVILTDDQREVENYYRTSKIFAFTSESEGFPNVIGEAQSFGLPVIAFDCVAGPSDMIHDNHNGFLIPLHNYDMFGQKLSLLMDSPELRERFGANAMKSIKQFSTEAIGNEFYDFIVPNK